MAVGEGPKWYKCQCGDYSNVRHVIIFLILRVTFLCIYFLVINVLSGIFVVSVIELPSPLGFFCTYVTPADEYVSLYDKSYRYVPM